MSIVVDPFSGVFGGAIFGDVIFADLDALSTSPPGPGPARAAGVGGSGFTRIDIGPLLDRIAAQGIDALDDEEIALLMLLGLL